MTTNGTNYVEGTVERVTGHGFRLVGQEQWLNLSRYAAPRPELPAVGATVRVGLDKDGFVRTIDVLVPPADEPRTAPASLAAPDREQRITRMACLNTATAILSSQGPVEIADVLAVAAEL